MTYDQLLQWGLPLFVCLVGCVCLWQAERTYQEAVAARVRNEKIVKLFLEAMLLVKLGAHDEAEDCMQRAIAEAE